MKILQSKNRRKKYIEDFSTLDIETSHNHNPDNPKAWITSIAMFDGVNYQLFRRVAPWLEYLDNIIVKYNLIQNECKYVIYVHNLSYDITYLLKWLVYHYNAIYEYKMLAVGTHKYITFTLPQFEFRCSWKLSNRSLQNWTESLNVEHVKKSGYYDYDAIIYPDTPLSKKELDYIANDVIGLYECLKTIMKLHNDNVLTIPLTSTGFIRRDARKFFRKDLRYRKLFENTRLDAELYRIAILAYHGAMTHGNRFLKGVNIKVDRFNTDEELKMYSRLNNLDDIQFIKHRDETSFYPSRNRCKKFPVGRYIHYSNIKDANISLQYIIDNSSKYSFLVEIDLFDITVKENIYFPIIQVYKCNSSNFKTPDFHILEDNGRLLELQGGCRLCFTELELLTIIEQYNFTYNIINIYMSKLEKIPEWLKDVTDKYYYGKIECKDKYLKCKKAYGDFDERTIKVKNELDKFKNGFNAIYGMEATNPIRDIVEYDISSNEWKIDRPYIDIDRIQEFLNKYYNNKNNFMSFQYGLYVTALAQFELIHVFNLIGQAYVIYSDTDSMYYLSNDRLESKLNKYVKKCHADAIEFGAYIEYKGSKMPYDGMELEDETITSFKFLHSKCYGYETIEDGLHLVIAGVKKFAYDNKGCKITREDELKNLDNLENGRQFELCGGTQAIYTYDNPHVEIINGHEVDVSDACIITPRIYTIKDVYENFDLDVIEEYDYNFLPD